MIRFKSTYNQNAEQFYCVVLFRCVFTCMAVWCVCSQTIKVVVVGVAVQCW